MEQLPPELDWTDDRGQRRPSVLSALAALGIALAVPFAYAIFWSQYGSVDLPPGVPATLYLLGAVVLVQAVRLVRMDDVERRLGAAGTAAGIGAMVLGLAPGSVCPGMGGCTAGLDPLLLLVAGLGLTTLSLYLHVDRYVASVTGS